jgi:hypothetical protein
MIQHLGMDESAVLSVAVADDYTQPPSVFQFMIPGIVEFRAMGRGWVGTHEGVIAWDCEGWFANGARERMYLYGKLAETAALESGRVLTVTIGAPHVQTT